MIVSWTIPAGGWLTYDIECSADGGATWTATCTRGAASSTATTYSETLTGVSNATAYRVRARAKNALGTAAWRESGDVPAISTPQPIADIDATRPTTTTIALSWPIPAGGWLSYDIQCSDDGGSTWDATCTRGVSTTTATTYEVTLTDVSNATAYKVRARAKNALGSADWRVSGDVPAVVTPQPIAAISAARPSTTTIAVSWTIPAGGWLSYDVECSTDGGSTYAACSLGAATSTATTYTETITVSPTQTYHVRARAENLLGTAAWRSGGPLRAARRARQLHEHRRFRAQTVGPLSPFTAPDAAGLANTTWSAATTAVRVGPTVPGSPFADRLDHEFRDSKTLAIDIANATAYQVRARAINPLGASTWTGAVSVPSISTPARIAAIDVERGEDTLIVSWTIPDGGWLSYDVECSADGGSTWTATCARGVATTTATSYVETLSGVATSTAYKVRARAKNALGTADWRETGSLPAISAPGRVAAIDVDRADGSLIVSWTVPQPATG